MRCHLYLHILFRHLNLRRVNIVNQHPQGPAVHLLDSHPLCSALTHLTWNTRSKADTAADTQWEDHGLAEVYFIQSATWSAASADLYIPTPLLAHLNKPYKVLLLPCMVITMPRNHIMMMNGHVSNCLTPRTLHCPCLFLIHAVDKGHLPHE